MRIRGGLHDPPGMHEQVLGGHQMKLQRQDLCHVVVGQGRPHYVTCTFVPLRTRSKIRKRVSHTAFLPGTHTEIELQVGKANGVVELGQKAQRHPLMFAAFGESETGAAPFGE